jgi:acetyltransferase-like isoleucine patch superfamily enzyme
MSFLRLLTSFSSSIRGRSGIFLRKALYPTIFKEFGFNVSIQPNVQFFKPHLIEIGDYVRISRNAILEARDNCKFAIGNRSILSENVYLRAGNSGKIHLMDEVRLDYGVYIRSEKEGEVDIGERTYIGPYTCIGGPGPIRIGSNCMISSHTAIYGNNHNFRDLDRNINEQGVTCKGIVIEDDCWLGAGAKILDGVTIGRGSVIGAGAVVTRDIPPYTVAVGVPAKVISRRHDKIQVER